MKDFQIISARVPRDVFDILRKLAKTEHRSINQQINLFLERALIENQEKEKVEVSK